MIIEDIIYDLMKRTDEEEWFDFKENWFNPVEIGEYIFAIHSSITYFIKNVI